MTMRRRFTPPWSVVELERGFSVCDASGRKLAYVHWDERMNALGDPLTRDEARRIAANIAKLPELLRPSGGR